MERRSCKIAASLHTKKQQACTNSPCLSSLIAENFMFQPAILLLLFQALAIFCGHMFSQSFLDLDQCPLIQHTVFIPELLMVCSEQEICICINEQNNPWSHRSVASRPIEWQRETQGHAPFLSMLAIQRACTEDSASAAMRGCSPRLNHASGEDGTSSHGSVAASPLNGSEEHRGAPRFCARAHAMQHACPEGCVYAAMRGCSPRLNRTMG
jgi:hypothetical protein